MRAYLAEWPNGTISILTAESEIDLFDKLDAEGDPTEARIFLMPTQFHLETNIQKNKIEVCEFDGKEPKEFHFSNDIFERVYF
jgi:hypothetical protein